jgi:hypothetical protein
MTESDAPEAGWAKLGAEPGLCLDCRHARLNETRRGTAYLRCGRSAWDDRLVRYPRLPVCECAGFEARATGRAGGTTDRSAEKLRPERGRWPAVRTGTRARARVIAGGNTRSAGIDCTGA